MSQQRRCPEGVDAGVDLANALLRGCERLLLDDGLDLRRIRRHAHDAAVAGGVGGRGGEDGHGGMLGLMELPRAARWSRAGSAARRRRAPECSRSRRWRSARALDGVAGAELLGLLDKLDAGRRPPQPSPARPGGRRRHRCRPAATTLLAAAITWASSGLAADLVQHLGPARLQPRSLARRHDDDGQTARLIACVRIAHAHLSAAADLPPPGCGMVMSIVFTEP